jgi:hypothetical protein
MQNADSDSLFTVDDYDVKTQKPITNNTRLNYTFPATSIDYIAARQLRNRHI